MKITLIEKTTLNQATTTNVIEVNYFGYQTSVQIIEKNGDIWTFSIEDYWFMIEL